MSYSKSRVHNPKYLEKYFTQFPNIIDDSGLDPYEYRLLIHYYRVGECWEGVRKTSEICKMSTGKVSDCRRSLEEKGFIRVEISGDGVVIYLVDLSEKNVKKYSEGVHDMNSKDAKCSPGERSVHVVNEGRSPGEHKNNHIKNNQLRITNTFSSSNDEDSKACINNSLEDNNQSEIEHQDSNKGRAPKKAKEPTIPEYAPFIEIWDTKYPLTLKFPRDGRVTKELILETRRQLEGRHVEPTPENCIEFWKIFVNSLERTWAHRRILPTINQHYPSLIAELEHGKSKSSSSAASIRDQTRDFINSL